MGSSKDTAMSASKNTVVPLVLTAVVCLFGLYSLLLAWARKEDVRDQKRAETFSLEDNCSTDEGQYEITLITGLCKGAGTTAKVFCVIIGDSYQTHERWLGDPFRVRFKRGAEDSFFLTTPKSLGIIQEIRVWHDDSGSSPSWFLCKVSIHDLVHGRSYHFICNSWLAIEYEDGQIDRTFTPSSKGELKSFRNVFYDRLKYYFTEYHIWMSIMFRPVKSNFTRVQRLSCFLAVIYANLLFSVTICTYTKFIDETDDILSSLPLLSVSIRVLLLAGLINVLNVSLHLILMWMFRSINKKPKLLIEAIKKSTDKSLDISLEQNQLQFRPSRYQSEEEFGDILKWLNESEHSAISDHKKDHSNNHDSLRYAQINMGFTESVMMFKTEKEMDEVFANDNENKFKRQVINTASQQDRSYKYMESSPKRVPSCKLERYVTRFDGIQKKSKLSYRFVVVVWLVVIFLIFSSAFIAIVFSRNLSYKMSQMVLASLCIGLLGNLLIVEPVKIVVLSIAKTLKPALDNADRDNININVIDDDNMVNNNGTRFFVPQIAAVSFTASKRKKEERRQERLKEVRLTLILKELLFYSIFIGCLAVVGFKQRDPTAYLLVKGINNIFIGKNSNYVNASLNEIDNYWTHTLNVIHAGLSPGEQCCPSKNLLIDCATNTLGPARLRQKRIKQGTCQVAESAQDIVKECNGEYNWDDEDDGNYYPGWRIKADKMEMSNTSKHIVPWTFRNARMLHTYPFIALIKTYSGGGYAIEINETSDETLRYLQSKRWIDKYTRVVFVEMNLYNAPTNLFLSVSLVTEFLPTNGAVKVVDVKVAQLYRPQQSVYLSVLACELIALAFLMCFIYRECKKIYRLKSKYFKKAWNWMEIIIMTLVAVSSLILVLQEVEKAVTLESARPADDNPQSFINIRPAATLEELYICCLGFLIFCSTLKLLKLMRFNHRILVLSKTLSLATPSLLSFGAVFFCTYIGYASVYYLTIGPLSKDYHTFITTLESLFSTLLGGFDFDLMFRQVNFIGPVFFCSFMVFVVMILMNIFLAIIIDSIAAARNIETLECEDMQLMEYAAGKLKAKLGIEDDFYQANNNKGFADEQDDPVHESNGRKLSKSYNNKNEPPDTQIPTIQIDNFEKEDKIIFDDCSSLSSSYSGPPNEQQTSVLINIESIGKYREMQKTHSSRRSNVNLDFELDVLSSCSSSETLSVPGSDRCTKSRGKSKQNQKVKVLASCLLTNKQEVAGGSLTCRRGSISAPCSPLSSRKHIDTDLRRQALKKSFKDMLPSKPDNTIRDCGQNSLNDDCKTNADETGNSACCLITTDVSSKSHAMTQHYSTYQDKNLLSPQILKQDKLDINISKSAQNSPNFARRQHITMQSVNSSLTSLSHLVETENAQGKGSYQGMGASSCNLKKDTESHTLSSHLSSSLSKRFVELPRKRFQDSLGLSTIERSLKNSSPQASPYLSRRHLDTNFGSTHSINAIGRYSVPSSPIVAQKQFNADSFFAVPSQLNMKLTSLGSVEVHGSDIFHESKEESKLESGNDVKNDDLLSKVRFGDNQHAKPVKLIDEKLKTLVKCFAQVCLNELVCDKIIEELIRKNLTIYRKYRIGIKTIVKKRN